MDILKGCAGFLLAIIWWVLSMAFYGVMIIGSLWLGYLVLSWIF